MYREFLDVFFKKEIETLLKRDIYDHVIHLKKNVQFLAIALYNMSQDEILKFRRYLNKYFNKKFIRVNRFETTISILLIKKFEKNIRFCVNYCDLNIIIVKNRYFLLLISKIVNRLNRVKIFIKFNIIVVFNKLKIKKDDKFLIAFRTRFELFEYLIMLFKLCNDFASFHSYINDALREYLNNFCIAYLDDILIYNDNKVEHKIYVKRVLTKLREVDLQINVIKCVFHVIEILYLKLTIIIKNVKMNFVKSNVIVE